MVPRPPNTHDHENPERRRSGEAVGAEVGQAELTAEVLQTGSGGAGLAVLGDQLSGIPPGVMTGLVAPGPRCIQANPATPRGVARRSVAGNLGSGFPPELDQVLLQALEPLACLLELIAERVRIELEQRGVAAHRLGAVAGIDPDAVVADPADQARAA